MGKTTRWFRALLGAKKSSESPTASTGSDSRSATEKKKFEAPRSFGGNGGTRGFSAGASSLGTYVEAVDANKHAIAVAAATAAVAEAALAAAKAAAEVVRLTSGGSRPSTAYAAGNGRRRESAAVKIQSAFRAYLARRALRALKGLVKLQALVRGHIVRKQSADMLRRMQAMARIQARACSHRAYIPESFYSTGKSTQPLHSGLAVPKRHDHQHRAYNAKFDGSNNMKKSNIKNNGSQERTQLNSNWLERWMEECTWNNSREATLKLAGRDDEKSDKILEVDTWKPHLNTRRSKNRSNQASRHQIPSWNNNVDPSVPRLSTNSQKPNPSLSSGEVLSLRSLKCPAEEPTLWTAESSPQVYSTMSRPGSSARGSPFAPMLSECSRSVFGGYPGHPNYMANTESYRAKVRSQSAPRQRMQFEPTNRYRGTWDVDTCSERGFDLHANSRTGAYQSSGR